METSSNPAVVVLVLYGIQGLLGAGLAGLFWNYHRAYRRPHLRLWSQSFVAFSLYLVMAGAALAVSQWSDRAGMRAPLTLASQILFYAHLALFVLGTLALKERQDPPMALQRGALAATVVLGSCTALAFAWDPAAAVQGFAAWVGLRYVVAAAAYAGTGYALLAGTPWRRASLGQRLVATSLIAFAALSLANSVLATSRVDGLVAGLVPWLPLFDLLAVCCIGIGLTVWLHDDERGRADRASLEIEQLTFYDSITGLPNRRLFAQRLRDRLPGASATGTRVGVLVFGADRPHQIRDVLGDLHAEALVARLLAQAQAVAPASEALFARLEGDRLAVALEHLSGIDTAAARARELQARLTQPFTGGRAEVFVTCSIGIATFPDDAADPDGLLAAALSAHRRAEAGGGNRIELASREVSERERETLAQAVELRRALGSDALELRYQPVLDVARGGFAFAEALLRWRHPMRGLLMPAQFLPDADDSGLLPEIDRWVLSAACRHAARRRSANGGWVPIAVNVSARTFEMPEFPAWVAAALAQSRLPPNMLEIEITEATAMRQLDRAIDTLARLRALGVSLSLDDFGVGYSTLSQLKHLAVDKIKIDQSFTAGVISDRKDAAIAVAMIGLGRSLGLRVVAEGVETAAQLAFFRTHGVDFVQGFLISPPLVADALTHRLHEIARPSADAG